MDGAASVQRLTLPNLGTDVTVGLGSHLAYGPYFAADLQASPASDGTVAVLRDVFRTFPPEIGGVVIYDDATARPNALCGVGQVCGCTGDFDDEFDSIHWNADGSVMFAANNGDGFTFYTIPVTASGFGKVNDYQLPFNAAGITIHYDPVTKYVYEDNGMIIDPIAGVSVGRLGNPRASGLPVADGALGKAFVLQTPRSGSDPFTLTSFDIQKLTPIATATISNVVGAASHFIRWGSDGLAFTTEKRQRKAG